MIMSASCRSALLHLPASLAASLERGLPWLLTPAFAYAFARCLKHTRKNSRCEELRFCICSTFPVRQPLYIQELQESCTHNAQKSGMGMASHSLAVCFLPHLAGIPSSDPGLSPSALGSCDACSCAVVASADVTTPDMALYACPDIPSHAYVSTCIM